MIYEKVEKDASSGIVHIHTIKCPDCRTQEVFTVSEYALSEYESGALMQKAFPMLNAGQRERLITGICGDCFDKMFSPEEGDEE